MFPQTKRSKRALAFVLVILAVGCALPFLLSNRQIEPSFYYWKTTFRLSQGEKQTIDEQNINRLYIRLFDVGWDNTINAPVPLGKFTFSNRESFSGDVTPVVYITNKVFVQINPSAIDSLALRLYSQVLSIAKRAEFTFDELQIDCDWTETTRASYFLFLKQLSDIAGHNGIALSATIRLHQIKYKQVTGVPPVSRGMLMFYNIGDLNAKVAHNSIYNSADAGKYIAYINSYPLTLDVALPIYTWAVQTREGKIIQLLSNYNHSDFKKLGFTRIDSTYYKASASFFYRGIYFMEGDIIEVESISPKLALEAAQLLSSKLPKAKRSVVLFSLDSLNIAQYEKEDFKNIFGCFR